MDRLTEDYSKLQCRSPRERKSPTGHRFQFPSSAAEPKQSSRRLDFSSGSPNTSPSERSGSWGRSMRDVIGGWWNKTFNMTCYALLQEHADQKTFGLVVVFQREGENPQTHPTHGVNVGGKIYPKQVKAGHLRINLRSSAFEADLAHGETSLTKDEPFKGHNFEVQFACKYKRSVPPGGLFGKVIVESVSDADTKEIFEFNLSKNNSGITSPDEDNWAKLSVNEIVGMLHIQDDTDWHSAAKRLGFTDHEIDSKFVPWDEDAHTNCQRLLEAYKIRRGRPTEFVQNLCASVPKETLHVPRSPRKRLKPRPLVLNDEHPLGFEASYLGDFSDSPRQRVSTPSTPQKRSAPSNVNIAETCVSPSKRLRRVSSGDTDFSFDFQGSDKEITDSKLWTVSGYINIKWKALGRNLQVPEDELLVIEHAHKNLRECSYQMLLKWKDMHPNNFNYSKLHHALLESGMNNVAQKLLNL